MLRCYNHIIPPTFAAGFHLAIANAPTLFRRPGWLVATMSKGGPGDRLRNWIATVAQVWELPRFQQLLTVPPSF